MENVLALPDAIIEKILLFTSKDLRVIAQASQVCKALKSIAHSDTLWLKICQARFTDTDPRLWIQQSPRKAGSRSPQAPTNYRYCCPKCSSSACSPAYSSAPHVLSHADIVIECSQMCLSPAVFLCIPCGVVEEQWQQHQWFLVRVPLGC